LESSAAFVRFRDQSAFLFRQGQAVTPKVINLRGRLDIDVPDDPTPRLRP